MTQAPLAEVLSVFFAYLDALAEAPGSFVERLSSFVEVLDDRSIGLSQFIAVPGGAVGAQTRTKREGWRA